MKPTTVEAVYQSGTLKLAHPLPLPDQAHVLVTIQGNAELALDSERAAWLRLSEGNLLKTWDNPGDDAFNELLQK
jgi:predicted DNA-binding antitoxin AbrB/MazE fold protein